MEQHSFLWKYSGLCIKKSQKESVENLNVSVTESENLNNSVAESENLNVSVAESENGNGNEKINGDAKLNEEKPKEESCYLLTSNLEVESGSTFWSEGWRKHLCRCSNCLKMYENEKVSFLLSETDTVQYYEKKNKELPKETQYEKEMRALSSLDRVKQVEAIEGKIN